MLSQLPEQDSNLRPPALESPSNGSLTTPYVGEARAFAPDSQADGVKSDAEPATKSQSILGSCELCDRYRRLTPLGRGDYVVWLCNECHDADRVWDPAVAAPAPTGEYLPCALCKRTLVWVGGGYDTCEDCKRRQ